MSYRSSSNGGDMKFGPEVASTLARPGSIQARALAVILATALLASPALAGSRSIASSAGAETSVIIRAAAGAEARIERLVASEGGTITAHLPIIDGFAATLPLLVANTIGSDPGVISVSPNAPLAPQTATYDPGTDVNSMAATTQYSGATAWWRAGYTGAGVDVAVIDTGVSPVAGLDGPNKVLYGPDLSLESQAPNLTNLDTYGHGTFMAGLIAGHDSTLTAPYDQAPASAYRGMAPDARIMSVKVGTADGGTDVSQMIAAIDWVVQHAHDPGVNVRVLNISYGTNSTQSYVLDPLAFAAEQAWKHGIVVVASAGNAGYQKGGSSPCMADPAYDPYLIAVGGSDSMGTADIKDDKVGSYSSTGAAGCKSPDFIAPGSHLQGLRVPNSYIDANHPEGRIGTRYFRGSGTSQAAAITSGTVALILQKYPNLTPDQVKKYYTTYAYALSATIGYQQGAGEIRLAAMLPKTPANYVQKLTNGTGTGTLEGSRGTDHISMDGVALSGAQDIMGATFDSAAMATLEAQGRSWLGGTWNGRSWTGVAWSGRSWMGVAWSGRSWSGRSWLTCSFTANSWDGRSWTGTTWNGTSWSGSSWSGASWATGSWT
jgi:serine protease AprX